ncbi:hypothetical protein BOX15_Mlig019699g1 [Macrostomum lignano]|uniref:EF-hand domain-containing protein n=1 Tax=Macrostomum lignano TaxID=282301 RepID=A0A267F6Y2_9PLAT|nr:hypothetical protein BOX15_Mlig019699g1 [Macrostomum lignano]
MTEASPSAPAPPAPAAAASAATSESDLDWVYVKLDPDNTGSIPVDEFYQFITQHEPARQCVEHTARYILGLFCRTQPGRLTRSELAAYISLCRNGTREDQYGLIFQDAGRRWPGWLARDELVRLIEDKYQQVLKPDFEDIFDNCDEDMDGRLTLAEFIKFIGIYEL